MSDRETRHAYTTYTHFTYSTRPKRDGRADERTHHFTLPKEEMKIGRCIRIGLSFFHTLYIMGLIDKLVARKHRLHNGTGATITEYAVKRCACRENRPELKRAHHDRKGIFRRILTCWLSGPDPTDPTRPTDHVLVSF
ncbi:hypothetical protein An12g08190 [Aspergillus niger]|uniref:Uncharacterized protein n=2 Tax=Aspergillus niger TaxID=5061 RepID=A2R0D1_ASPNC|nr:hypothetical protein An12g08190 [Aspergillus niger]CAK41269.1 hypothetical protein An12g08190 [Aspergillus niger]